MSDVTPASGLSVRSLSRRFGPRWVLIRVSFEVPPGGAMLLLGHNGSGKTTLVRCLATALRPHDGDASFEGRSLWAHRDEARAAVALLSHDNHLYEDLSARENLAVWARMGSLSPDLGGLLERVGLAETGPRPVRAFSAGMRKRLALARALMKAPRLVLLDEPFSALDPQGRELMAQAIREIRATGATLVLSTHLAEHGAALCDQALRLEAGRVVWRGPATEAAAQLGAS